MTLKLNDLPDVSFAEKDINRILSDMINGYENAYFEQTGVKKKLYPGDPIRIFLYAQALRELQLRYMIDDAAKQNLLKYSRGDNLDNLGSFSRTERFQATAATVTMRFNLSAVRPTNEIIPKGTRVSPGTDIYFTVEEDITIPAGSLSGDVNTVCSQNGVVGNDFTPGQINILVDPIPFVASVENLEESYGGTELEIDNSYRDRIHLAPEGFSVAGPDGAYEYFSRLYSPLIEDIRITSPSPGTVDIRVLLKSGELPTISFLEGLQTYLSDRSRRPLTDNVVTGAPTTVNYDLDITYFISDEDKESESLIQTRVNQAIDDYIVWQRSKIGRDINESELGARIRLAGAKRAVITAPLYAPVDANSVATLNLKTVTYGGIEIG